MVLKRATPTAPPLVERRQAPRDAESLVRQLADSDPRRRRYAARDLAGHADASTPLVALLRAEPDVSVREVALSSLMQIGDAIAVHGLVECLHSEEASLRNQAIEAMKSLPKAVAPIMRDLLSDADPDVRILAINVLESLRHPEVEHWLIEVIDADPLVNVCGTAVDLLSEVGTARAADALRRLQARFPEEPYIQFAAGLALRRIASS